MIPYKFKNYFFQFYEKCLGCFDRGCIKSVFLFIVWTFNNLILSVQEHGVSFLFFFVFWYHLQYPSLVFHSFQSIVLSLPWLSLLLGMLFFLMRYKMGLFLFSLSVSSLFAYRKATDFCI